MKTAAIAAGLFGLASAHMEMSNPAPFRSKFNDFTTDIDYSMTSPLNQAGGDFPCKGYHSLMGTPQGQSVANYAPGQSYTFTITGGTIHDGGSCQASLSYDQGATWTVIHSYIGNCPISTGDTNYDFTIPNDTPAGEALFGWSWFNKIGNREMYMNCAVVTIGGAAKEARAEIDARDPSDSFSSRPAMFVANVGTGCGTTETKDLEFPNPGPDVTRSTPETDTAPPTGSCAEGKKAPTAPEEPKPEPKPEPEKPAPKPTSMSVPPSPSTTPIPKPKSSSPAGGQDAPTSASTNTSLPATSPGGVFMTVPAESSTLVTKTKTAEPKPTADDSVEGAMTVGEACDKEGEWNCVGGSQFQRCASGNWSQLQDVYPGTTCTPGQSSALLIAREKSPAKNYRQVLKDSRRAARAAAAQ